MRLVDFQVSVRPGTLGPEQRRQANKDRFPVYEAIRLWLKERKVVAPFRKILISLSCGHPGERRDCRVITSMGICEALVVVDAEEALASEREPQFTCSRILEAFDSIASETGWKNEEMASLVRGMASQKMPIAHCLAGLTKQHKNGILCEVLLVAEPRHTEIVVRFSLGSHLRSEAVVASHPGPLFMEDDFPVAISRLVGEDFLLLTKERNAVSKVPLPKWPHAGCKVS